MRKGKAALKRILCILMLSLMAFLNSGLSFNAPIVDMDPDENPSYEYADLGEIITAAGSDRAADTFKNKYYWTYGIVRSINLEKRTVSLAPGDDEKISLEFKNVKTAGGVAVKDTVRVYFRIVSGIIGSKANFEIDRMERSEIRKIEGEVFSTADGRMLKADEGNKRTLGDGKMVYHIPDAWKNVEADIRENELGSIDGYQYKLNKLGKGEAYSECIFVTYFDKTKMVDVNDINENKRIEKAIVKDILKKDVTGNFPLREISTSYGPGYKYYRGNYKRSTGETYLTEFVFQEQGDGIAVILYLYRDKKHLNDIMNVLRTVRVSG